MGRFNFLFFAALALVIPGCDGTRMAADDQSADLKSHTADFDTSGWDKEQVTADELITWQLLGEGKLSKAMGEQVCLEESDQSKGVMLLSPAYYPGDVVIRYKALALSPASVFVTVLSAKDLSADELTIPGNYDGTMGFWTTESSNYFFAFKNAPHGGTPFIMKNPGGKQLANATEQDLMVAGVYYAIEVGREGTKLWLSINGKRVVDAVDETPLVGGHIALRLRGTAGLQAIGLIKDLAIYTKS